MQSFHLLIAILTLLVMPSAILAVPEHPRLLVTTADWEALPARMEADPIVDRIIKTTIERADNTLEKPLLKYHREGRRILSISREAIKRVIDLSTAWKVTGEPKYLDRCRDEMLRVSSFEDWNPSHHLDTAEMQTALAIGYDWLFHDLTQDERKTISTALRDKGMKSTFAQKNIMRWHTNWNQVCMGGMTLSAIALMDLEPELSNQALAAARNSIPIALEAGYPADGAYAEGGGYWSYGTSYTILTIEALRTANLPFQEIRSHRGFLESAGFIRQVYGTSGLLFNYGDNHPTPPGFNPSLIWMAKQNQSEALNDFIAPTLDEIDASSGNRLLALAAFWLPEKASLKESRLSTHFVGTGLSPIAIHRSGFDSDDLFLGIKAGHAQVSHGHMDAGSFVIDGAGHRWASDLGHQKYHDLESLGINLFEMTQTSERWSVFRLNNFSHNTLTYNGRLHQIHGKADIVSSKGAPEHETLVNLAPPLGLPERATAVRRFVMDPEQRTITITDSLTGLKPDDEITWNLFTPATSSNTDSGFLLSTGDSKMQLGLSSPQSSQVKSGPADPPPNSYDAPNPGITRIQLNATADHQGEIFIRATYEALD